MTSKGVQAYNAALQVQAPWVSMLGEDLDAKSIKAAAKVLEGLRQRLEHPSRDGADEE
jgi:hypothetical protein